ncbi:MAG: hypothetical protein ACREBG_02925 [Pyrinomonadaceae bacterium]
MIRLDPSSVSKKYRYGTVLAMVEKALGSVDSDLVEICLKVDHPAYPEPIEVQAIRMCVSKIATGIGAKFTTKTVNGRLFIARIY